MGTESRYKNNNVIYHYPEQGACNIDQSWSRFQHNVESDQRLTLTIDCIRTTRFSFGLIWTKWQNQAG